MLLKRSLSVTWLRSSPVSSRLATSAWSPAFCMTIQHVQFSPDRRCSYLVMRTQGQCQDQKASSANLEELVLEELGNGWPLLGVLAQALPHHVMQILYI